jgi:hypothetical protein
MKKMNGSVNTRASTKEMNKRWLPKIRHLITNQWFGKLYEDLNADVLQLPNVRRGNYRPRPFVAGALGGPNLELWIKGSFRLWCSLFCFPCCGLGRVVTRREKLKLLLSSPSLPPARLLCLLFSTPPLLFLLFSQPSPHHRTSSTKHPQFVFGELVAIPINYLLYLFHPSPILPLFFLLSRLSQEFKIYLAH